LFYGPHQTVKQTLFSEIMPMLKSGSAEFGVCIHEGRFTWQTQGLSLVEDLGTRWERETSKPLPLGGILARRKVGCETIAKIQATIRDSIEFGLANREQTLTTMRRYAQEFEDAVLFKHVDLYINHWTIDLGDDGEEALQLLSEKAHEAGISNHSPRIQVWR
jgi:1,4-dihydroxy-6-naphthoate synthase